MLNNILGSVVSSALQGNEGLSKAVQLLQNLVQSLGGVDGLMAKFQQEGLEGIVKSWLSSGENLPISAKQIIDLFGEKPLDSAANAVGVSQNEASNLLSEYLPKIVDKLSPEGEFSLKNLNVNDLVAEGAKSLLGKMFS